MHKLIAGLAAGLALLVAAPVASAANVSVRVEGTGDTLLPRTAATTSAGTFTKDGDPAHSCSSNSAGGALEAATAGDWTGQWFTFGDYQAVTIKGERHVDGGSYWSFWHNYQYSSTGLCTTLMQEGDDVLLFPGCFSGCAKDPSPLRITAVPESATPRQAFEVRVVQYDVSFDPAGNATTTQAPASGASVSAGGRSFAAGADGVAHVTVDSKGVAGVRAVKDGYVRSASEPVCVDCGTPPPATPGAPGALAKDTVAPATVVTLRNGAVFSRRRAPRLLRGSVASDPSGLLAVKLRLTRRVGKKCSYFSGRRERFVPMRCGRGSFFKIGDRADWSYLLPKRLGRGRYLLEAKAVDGAYNRGAVSRTRFRVR